MTERGGAGGVLSNEFSHLAAAWINGRELG